MFPHYRAVQAFQAERYPTGDPGTRIKPDRGMNPWKWRLREFAIRVSAHHVSNTPKLSQAGSA